MHQRRELLAAQENLEAKQTQLKALEARKTAFIEAVENAKTLPEKAREDLERVLAAYVVGQATETELKAARKKIADAETRHREIEDLRTAVERAIMTAAREIGKATETLRAARKRTFSAIAADLGGDCRAIIEERLYSLVAAEYLARGGFDLNNAPIIVGNILFSAFFPQNEGFSRIKLHEKTRLLEEQGA